MFLILCPLPHHPYNRVVIALRRYIPLHYHVLPLRLCDFEAEKGGLLKKVETLQVVFLLTPLFFHDTDWDIGVVVLSTVLVLLQLLHVEFVQPVGNDVLGIVKSWVLGELQFLNKREGWEVALGGDNRWVAQVEEGVWGVWRIGRGGT